MAEIEHDVHSLLKAADLRPTQQRVALASLLYGKGDRHVTAEGLYEEALAASLPVSLATVYNTLHQFTRRGLLRELSLDGARTYFDTNLHNHHHFFMEDGDMVIDIPAQDLETTHLPPVPEGMEVVRVDVVVRLRRKEG